MCFCFLLFFQLLFMQNNVLNTHKTGFPRYFLHIILLTSFLKTKKSSSPYIFYHHSSSIPSGNLTQLWKITIFNSYVKLPEGTTIFVPIFSPPLLPRLFCPVAVGQAGDFQRSAQRQGAHDGQQHLGESAQHHVGGSEYISDGYI